MIIVLILTILTIFNVYMDWLLIRAKDRSTKQLWELVEVVVEQNNELKKLIRRITNED